MAASWLAQMGWQVAVLDAPWPSAGALDVGPDRAPQPAPPAVRSVTAALLSDWLATGDVAVVDVTASASYVERHVPGAWLAVRSQLPNLLPELLTRLGTPRRVVLTCGSSLRARFAAKDIEGLLMTSEVWVFEGGTAAWIAAGQPVETGETHLLSQRIDRYQRPYEGIDNATAMQAYLDWEFGLVEQLGRDGTHPAFSWFEAGMSLELVVGRGSIGRLDG